jgi:proline iminopeptidase
MPEMDPEAPAEIRRTEESGDTDDPRYMELLMEQHDVHHILRMPPEEWPDPVHRALEHVNPDVYVPMQGPSELGAGGTIARWDRTADLGKIAVPTLVIGARHDTMDPRHLEWMARTVRNGRFPFCPNGSHLAMYDDPETCFGGLIRFLQDVEEGKMRVEAR